ncbi:hypothetical protein [Cohnella mopanensis]|uniref:hypothetical protein n=1 Tax=Cohnella mopanensis TaxID=2911966 RepID=UPI001EF83288|nr:hypothetical protein [Cohnella mopanensis]
MPMFPIKQWGILIISGILVVLLLSQIPSVEQDLEQRRQSVAVFKPNDAKWLTDDNMVDRLAKLPLHNRLVKVGWDHAILTIDLQGGDPAEVWADIGKMIIFSYSEVNNVKHVLIRVFSEVGDHRLLLAAETRKTDWSETQLAEINRGTFKIGDESNENLRFSVTSSGKRWIANFANS